MKNIDINKIVLSNKASFCKNGFICFIDYKHVKKLDIFAYFSQN